MKAITACIDTIRGRSDFKSNNELQQLHTVLQDATTSPDKLHELIQQSKQQNKAALPRVDHTKAQLPRVEATVEGTQRITRAMSKQISSATCPVLIQAKPTFTNRKKKHRPPDPAPPHDIAAGPAMNARAKTAANAKLAAPPALNTRARKSKLRQPTPAPPNL